MNENGKNKREWVKNAAIVFLAVMLVLTFFSNTIMKLVIFLMIGIKMYIVFYLI